MAKLAYEMKYYLQRPVVDKTGLTGSYDFWVKPFDPENKDVSVAMILLRGPNRASFIWGS